MSEKTFSLKGLREADDTKYAEVEGVYGGTVAIGSLCSEDMIEWLDSNDEAGKKREAGLRLIVKSIGEVTARDEAGNITAIKRLSKEEQAEYMGVFRKKDARSNGKLVQAILVLNEMRKSAEALKNESGEVSPAASPSNSPSQ